MSAIPNLPTPLTDATDGIPTPPSFTLHDQPVENQRKLKVIVVGAGYSGIYLGIRIPERLRNVELVIYEKNAGVGGTWWENRYPGCACDIPSHSYQYSFEPNPSWSSLYAPAGEIQAYLESVAHKYSVNRFIKLAHEVTGCRWEEGKAKWHVTVKKVSTRKEDMHGEDGEDGWEEKEEGVGEEFEDTADVLIMARGSLNTPSWPEIEGLETFGGEVMHSARWNESYDFSHKRTAILGTGSSAIQIIPALQRLPNAHLSVFARSRTWISPPFGQHLWDKHGFTGVAIPHKVREVFAAEPDLYLKFRLAVEEDGNSIHAVTLKGTPMQIHARELFEKHMRERLKNKPEILDAMMPRFSPGCRRLTPGRGLLEALTEENVAFVTAAIERVSERAVHTADGKTHEADVLVCATGFKVGVAPPFGVVGRRGRSLEHKWEGRATSYLSLAVEGFPNMWMMLGPNAAIGSGSLTMMIESFGDYIVRSIRKLQKENIAAMSVLPAREADFIEYVDAYFKGTVFSEDCRSWYKNKGTGEITGLWPGSTLHCIETLRSPRWEDYTYRYVGEDVDEEEEDAVGDVGDKSKKGKGNGKGKKRVNRLAWLGNGFSQNEVEKKHLAWYLYPEFCRRPVQPRPEENGEFGIRAFSH